MGPVNVVSSRERKLVPGIKIVDSRFNGDVIFQNAPSFQDTLTRPLGERAFRRSNSTTATPTTTTTTVTGCPLFASAFSWQSDVWPNVIPRMDSDRGRRGTGGGRLPRPTLPTLHGGAFRDQTPATSGTIHEACQWIGNFAHLGHHFIVVVVAFSNVIERRTGVGTAFRLRYGPSF